MGSCLSQEPEVDFDGPVDFNHFQILRAIGKGAFGKVCIVKKKDTKQMYALKYMNKVQMIHKHALENVFREIRILRNLEHPFLVNLWFTFHDREDIFMVLDLMLGGDISYHLEKAGRFSVERVRLYLAELALALDYLRSRRIIHRDIKPANMLLDSQGHVHLTDFNVATMVRAGHPITSTTGTKPYMAPEVVQSSSRGYSHPVDWWGLGVSAYEMLRGSRPFVIDKHMTGSAMHTLLTKTRPSASASWDKDTCDILKMLLHPDEDKRLQSATTLKSHPFFHSLDWEEVEQKKATPPFVPPQNRINCDPTHELEEMIVEPNPLHKKQHRLSKRNQRTEDAEVEKELARIDEKFKVYNRQKENDKSVAAKEEAKKPLDESTESGTPAEELASGSHGGEGVESASKTSRNSEEVGEVVEDKHLSVSAAAWSEGDKTSAEKETGGNGGSVEEQRAISVVEVEMEGEEAESPSRVGEETSLLPTIVVEGEKSDGSFTSEKTEDHTTPPTAEKLASISEEEPLPTNFSDKEPLLPANPSDKEPLLPTNPSDEEPLLPTNPSDEEPLLSTNPSDKEPLLPTNPSESEQKHCDSDDAVTQLQEVGVDSVTQGADASVVVQGDVKDGAADPSCTGEDVHSNSDPAGGASRLSEDSGPGDGEVANGEAAGSENESHANNERLKNEVVIRSEDVVQNIEEEGEAALGMAGCSVEPEQNGIPEADALPK